MYIAESHRLAEKFREALTLYDRVVVNVRSAIAHFQQCEFDVKVGVNLILFLPFIVTHSL